MVTAEGRHHYDSLTRKEKQAMCAPPGYTTTQQLTDSTETAVRTLICRFGIECPDRLEWSGWQAGGEYSRKLVVRNVSNSTVKFKYKLPRSKYFSMAFPEPVSLMAGMSVPLKVGNTCTHHGITANFGTLGHTCSVHADHIPAN